MHVCYGDVPWELIYKSMKCSQRRVKPACVKYIHIWMCVCGYLCQPTACVSIIQCVCMFVSLCSYHSMYVMYVCVCGFSEAPKVSGEVIILPLHPGWEHKRLLFHIDFLSGQMEIHTVHWFGPSLPPLPRSHTHPLTNQAHIDEWVQRCRLEGKGSDRVCDGSLMAPVDEWKCILCDLDELSNGEKVSSEILIFKFKMSDMLLKFKWPHPQYFSILPHEYEWSDSCYLILS